MESTYPSLVYSILELLHQNGESMLFTEILNALSSTPGADILRILEFMITEKLISGKLASYERIRITSRGIAELFAYRDKLAEEAAKVESPEPQCEKHTNTPTVDTEQKAVKKKIKINWRIVVDVFIALAGIAAAIITLIAAKG